MDSNSTTNNNTESKAPEELTPQPQPLTTDAQISATILKMFQSPETASVLHQLLKGSHTDLSSQQEKSGILQGLRQAVGTFSGRESVDFLHDYTRNMDRFLNRVTEDEASKLDFALSTLWSSANRWVEKTIALNPELICDWPTLKKELLLQYTPPEYEMKTLTKLQNLKQGSRTVKEYTDEFIALSMQIQPMRDLEAKTDYLNVLHPEIQQAVRANRSNFESLESLMKAADLSCAIERSNGQTPPPHHKRPEALITEPSKTHQVSKRKRKLVCQICDGEHFNSKCPEVTKMVQERSKKRSNYPEDQTKACELHAILDSACTQHMLPSDPGLVNKVTTRVPIIAANGQTLEATSKGDLHVHSQNQHIHLKSVLVVPGLLKPLISVRALGKDGYKVTFLPEGACKVSWDDEEFNCRAEDNQYVAKLTVYKTQEAMMTNTDRFDLWHERLDHPGTTKI